MTTGDLYILSVASGNSPEKTDSYPPVPNKMTYHRSITEFSPPKLLPDERSNVSIVTCFFRSKEENADVAYTPVHRCIAFSTGITVSSSQTFLPLYLAPEKAPDIEKVCQNIRKFKTITRENSSASCEEESFSRKMAAYSCEKESFSREVISSSRVHEVFSREKYQTTREDERSSRVVAFIL
jgi:hypothetical protein